MAQPVALFNTVEASALGYRTDGVSVSGTTTYYGIPMSGHHSGTWSLHLVWSGTPNGTFTLWESNVPNPDLTSDADWVQDTTFSPTNPAGSASKMFDNVANGGARWWRVKYVNSSGSGTLKGFAVVVRTNKD